LLSPPTATIIICQYKGPPQDFRSESSENRAELFRLIFGAHPPSATEKVKPGQGGRPTALVLQVFKPQAALAGIWRKGEEPLFGQGHFSSGEDANPSYEGMLDGPAPTAHAVEFLTTGPDEGQLVFPCPGGLSRGEAPPLYKGAGESQRPQLTLWDMSAPPLFPPCGTTLPCRPSGQRSFTQAGPIASRV